MFSHILHVLALVSSIQTKVTLVDSAGVCLSRKLSSKDYDHFLVETGILENGALLLKSSRA